METDEIGTNILSILEENSRTSYRVIKEKLGLSIGTIHNRIKKLKTSGIIKKFTVELDEKKMLNPSEYLGYISMLMTELLADDHYNLKGLKNQISEIEKNIIIYLQ